MSIPHLLTINNASTSAPTNTTVPIMAISVDFHELVNRAGANMLRNVTQAVKVYKIDIVVLIVTICPNLEKG